MSNTTNAVLVTGAAMGIGRAVAEALAAEGRPLVLFDRDAKALQQAAAALGGNVVAHTGSVANLPDCEAAVRLAVERFGGLAGVSHNAGIQRYGDVITTSEALWNEVMDVNLRGGFNVAKAAMPELRRNKGVIVLMGSVQGMAAQKGALAYVVAQSTDVGKWQQFGEQMLGAMTAPAAGGGLFVKLDERDFRMAIVPGAEDRYLASGWEVASEADFKATVAAIEKAGVTVTPGSADLKKARGFKDVATFTDPSGGGGSITLPASLTDTTVRAGLNFHF